MNIHGILIQRIIYRNIQVSAILIKAKAHGSLMKLIPGFLRKKLNKPTVLHRKYFNIRIDTVFFRGIEYHQFVSAILIKIYQVNFEYALCVEFIIGFAKGKVSVSSYEVLYHIRIQCGCIDCILILH